MKLAPICLLAACGTTESSSLLTSGMSAVMSASASGDGTTQVSASLYSGDPDQLIFVDLQGSDKLTATHGSDTMTLGKLQVVTIIQYGATFQTDNANDQFTIDLSRSLDAGAPSSTASLPAKLALGTLASSYSRASAITVTWSPSSTSDLMKWSVDSSCLQPAGAQGLTDTGTLTIAAGTLLLEQGQNIPTSCMATLDVARYRPGTLDSHFGHGGTIVGEQIRSATFTTTP